MQSTILVTGGAGFIGSALIQALNERGEKNILVTDEVLDEEKQHHLKPLAYDAYLSASDLLKKLEENSEELSSLKTIFHLGACSSTLETNREYLMKNNFEYTRTLAEWALERDIRFVYASSAATYGDGSEGMKDGIENLDQLKPLNLYGMSKHLFDLHARDQGWFDRIVGVKYFNVFGPNEGHKKEMRSLVCKAYEQILATGKVKLFKSYRPDYRDGEQQRDFVYVKDAVDMTLHLAFTKNLSSKSTDAANNCVAPVLAPSSIDYTLSRCAPSAPCSSLASATLKTGFTNVGGLFNIGTATPRTWLDLARALFGALDREPVIEFIDMPEHLQHQYQYYTCADISQLLATGYRQPSWTLEAAVNDYVKNYLMTGKHLGEELH